MDHLTLALVWKPLVTLLPFGVLLCTNKLFLCIVVRYAIAMSLKNKQRVIYTTPIKVRKEYSRIWIFQIIGFVKL